MVKFLKRTCFYMLLVILVHIVVGALFANGRTDAFYLRFTSPRQKSLIIGTSRAAQALQPKHFNEILQEQGFDMPLYNFSFTIAHSPFGPSYLRAIKKKLDPTTENGLFIVAVDPWSLSKRSMNGEDDPALFSEKNLCVGNMSFFNIPANYEYLVKNYEDTWGTLVFKTLLEKSMELRDDGWLDVDVPMDSEIVARRTKQIINSYKNDSFLLNRSISEKRFEYLGQIITFLKRHGRVYLVRLPVSKTIKELEDELIPGFSDRVYQLPQKYNIPYFDFLNDFEKYQFTDGSHLYKESGARLSRELARKINEIGVYLDNPNHI